MLQFRPLLASDQATLWHWLHVALWDPPPAKLRPVSVLDSAEVRIYAESWGKSTDVGVVAVINGVDAGACWVRLIKGGDGLAYVDDQTPQLGIALDAEYQRRGYGRPMMLATLQAARDVGYTRVSLTVHPQNPAAQMYESCGFARQGVREGFILMLAKIA